MTSGGRYVATATTCQWACTVCGAAVPVEARDTHDQWHDAEPVEDAAWQARQQAIAECAADLAKALGSESETSWPHLVERAELLAAIARRHR